MRQIQIYEDCKENDMDELTGRFETIKFNMEYPLLYIYILVIKRRVLSWPELRAVIFVAMVVAYD